MRSSDGRAGTRPAGEADGEGAESVCSTGVGKPWPFPVLCLDGGVIMLKVSIMIGRPQMSALPPGPEQSLSSPGRQEGGFFLHHLFSEQLRNSHLWVSIDT